MVDGNPLDAFVLHAVIVVQEGHNSVLNTVIPGEDMEGHAPGGARPVDQDFAQGAVFVVEAVEETLEHKTTPNHREGEQEKMRQNQRSRQVKGSDHIPAPQLRHRMHCQEDTGSHGIGPENTGGIGDGSVAYNPHEGAKHQEGDAVQQQDHGRPFEEPKVVPFRFDFEIS